MSPLKSSATLSNWIEVATSGLPASAKIRLKHEIEDHYSNLLRQQLTDGQPQEQAESRALEQLGQANQIGMEYRDAHFSRHRYARATWAVAILLLIHIINAVTWAIFQNMERNSAGFVYNDIFVAFDQYLLPWNALMSIVSAVLILIIARTVLRLLRERYDLKIPRIINWLFVIGVCCSAIGMAVTTAMDWFTNAMLTNGRWDILKVTQETQTWNTLLSVFSTLRGLAPIVCGIALLLFCLAIWKPIYRSANLRAQLLVLMIGGVGAVVIFNTWITVFSWGVWIWRFYRYYTPYVMPVLMLLLALSLILPLTTFCTMSRSGYTLEAGE